MTWAWHSLPHPSSTRSTGWAWVSVPGAENSAVAANALSNFVSQTLQRDGSSKDGLDAASKAPSARAAGSLHDTVTAWPPARGPASARSPKAGSTGALRQSDASHLRRWGFQAARKAKRAARCAAGDHQLARRLEQLRESAIADRIARGFMFAKIEDPSLSEGSSAVQYMRQQMSVVLEARKLLVSLQGTAAGAQRAAPPPSA